MILYPIKKITEPEMDPSDFFSTFKSFNEYFMVWLWLYRSIRSVKIDRAFEKLLKSTLYSSCPLCHYTLVILFHFFEEPYIDIQSKFVFAIANYLYNFLNSHLFLIITYQLIFP